MSNSTLVYDIATHQPFYLYNASQFHPVIVTSLETYEDARINRLADALLKANIEPEQIEDETVPTSECSEADEILVEAISQAIEKTVAEQKAEETRLIPLSENALVWAK